MLRLRRLLALIVVAPVAFAVAPAQAVTRDGGGGARAIPVASAASRTVVTLGGVRVRLPAGSEQVVTVNRTAGWHARVKLWQRDTSGWRVLARTHDGRIGYGGLAVARTRKQATGTTPLGTFGLLSAFGTHARAARWTLPYRTIQRGDFWVEDNASAYYNRYRNQAEGGFRWWLPLSDPDSSERLSHYPTQYEYAIVIGFNYARPVRHRGAGIFLHVNGRRATAGCVSTPRWFMRRAMATLDPASRPVIAIGR